MTYRTPFLPPAPRLEDAIPELAHTMESVRSGQSFLATEALVQWSAKFAPKGDHDKALERAWAVCEDGNAMRKLLLMLRKQTEGTLINYIENDPGVAAPGATVPEALRAMLGRPEWDEVMRWARGRR